MNRRDALVRVIDMLHAEIAGCRSAALAIAPEAAERIDAWAGRRRVAAEIGGLGLRVGHRDVLAWFE